MMDLEMLATYKKTLWKGILKAVGYTYTVVTDSNANHVSQGEHL